VVVSTQDGTPTGQVSLVEGATVLATGSLVDGRSALATPAAGLGIGVHTLTVRYAGDAARAASQDTVTVTVTKASSATRVTAMPRPATAGKKVTITVKVASAVEATGTVRISIRRGTKLVLSRTVEVLDGEGHLRLRLLAAGRHRITATYAGSATVAPSSATTALRVIRAGR